VGSRYRARNEATTNLVMSKYAGTNSVVVVVVIAAPPGTAGNRSPGTAQIINPASVLTQMRPRPIEPRRTTVIRAGLGPDGR
jgi:hypothetical protein